VGTPRFRELLDAPQRKAPRVPERNEIGDKVDMVAVRDVHGTPEGHPAGLGDTTSALPTTSMSESPGIHSTAMQAREGALPGLK